MPVPDECAQCDPASQLCPEVFDRIVVRFTITQGTAVYWDLLPTFMDPPPHEFQLQVGTTGLNTSDDWTDVGLPVTNGFVAVDPEQRVFGDTNWTHYRIILTTPNGVYTSEPVGVMGVMNFSDWGKAHELIRKEKLEMGLGCPEGYLIKRRVTGARCPRCLDFQTDEVHDPRCPVCFGTGFLCGYYFPLGCVPAKLEPRSTMANVDAQGRGSVDDTVVEARMIMLPLITEYDLWVNKNTDDRWYIRGVKNVAELRGIPLVADVNLRLAPETDVAYNLQIPDQLQEILHPMIPML